MTEARGVIKVELPRMPFHSGRCRLPHIPTRRNLTNLFTPPTLDCRFDFFWHQSKRLLNTTGECQHHVTCDTGRVFLTATVSPHKWLASSDLFTLSLSSVAQLSEFNTRLPSCPAPIDSRLRYVYLIGVRKNTFKGEQKLHEFCRVTSCHLVKSPAENSILRAVGTTTRGSIQNSLPVMTLLADFIT